MSENQTEFLVVYILNSLYYDWFKFRVTHCDANEMVAQAYNETVAFFKLSTIVVFVYIQVGSCLRFLMASLLCETTQVSMQQQSRC
jgi:hypothetical protein